MYVCYICKDEFGLHRNLKFHVIGRHLLLGTAGSLVCGQKGSLKSFPSVTHWYRHIRCSHKQSQGTVLRESTNVISDGVSCDLSADESQTDEDFSNADVDVASTSKENKPLSDASLSGTLGFSLWRIFAPTVLLLFLHVKRLLRPATMLLKEQQHS